MLIRHANIALVVTNYRTYYHYYLAAELPINISMKENTTQGYNSPLEDFIANHFHED